MERELCCYVVSARSNEIYAEKLRKEGSQSVLHIVCSVQSRTRMRAIQFSPDWGPQIIDKASLQIPHLRGQRPSRARKDQQKMRHCSRGKKK